MLALRSRVGTAATGSARTLLWRWRGVAGEFLGSGSRGSPTTTSALPVKEMWCSAALRVLPLPAFDERDDSLIIHGHGGRDERELPDAQNPRELAA